jgi:hypothetical protein
VKYAEALAGLADIEIERIDFELIFDPDCGLPRNAGTLFNKSRTRLYTMLRRQAREWATVRVLSCFMYPCRPELIQLDRCTSVMDGLDARVHILMPLMPTMQHGLSTKIHKLR